MASTKTASPKKTHLQIVEEILHLERKISYLERHLLFLYQSAFEKHFAASPFTANSASANSSRDDTDLQGQDSLPQSNETAEQAMFTSSSGTYSSSSYSPLDDHTMTMGKTLSRHLTLADHLGTTIQDLLPESASKLSQDIIRCMADVYCKLASSTNQQPEMLASASSSSFASSSTLSPKNASQILSPQCWCEAALSPCSANLAKSKHDPYKDMIEVSKIFIDGERFEFASKKLKIFSSFIGRLEDVDPRKMEQQEQLAFWINIHNALVMHAFLAHEPRKISSVHEAAYHIGGQSVNIYAIQSLILGCGQPHCPTSFIAPFASSLKQRKPHSRHGHPYALDHPEPLAHFALSMGAYSDPAVRIYTAKVHQELKLAKKEYIQAKVSIQKGKVVLPRLLYYYAKEASIELSQLIQMVSFCTHEAEQRAIQECFLRKGRRSVKLAPYETDFRFLLHRDLVK